MFKNFTEEYGEIRPIEEFLPQDIGVYERTYLITRDALTSPKQAAAHDVHYAIEEWEDLKLCVSDARVSDLVGVVIELLEKVFQQRRLSLADMARGKASLVMIGGFLGLPSSRAA